MSCEKNHVRPTSLEQPAIAGEPSIRTRNFGYADLKNFQPWPNPSERKKIINEAAKEPNKPGEKDQKDNKSS